MTGGRTRKAIYPHLLSPVRLGDLSLPNRMVMPPMTRFRVSQEGVPSALNGAYYAQRAAAGLLIAEGAYVEPKGRLTLRTAGLYTAEQVEAWRQVTEAASRAGGRMFIQLCHGGRVSHPRLQPGGADPVAPSAIAHAGLIRVAESEDEALRKVPATTPRALETGEVHDIVDEFGRATQRARQAGFEGVELHASSGLLHQQFLTPSANRRTDGYGGSESARCRFVVETLEAMIAQIGPGRVGVKIGPTFAYNGVEMAMADIVATYSTLLRELSRLNLAYVHVQRPAAALRLGPADFDAIGFVRQAYDGTLVGAGDFDRSSGEAAVATGACDLIAFGRRFIANPDLPERIRRDADENGWDEATLYSPEAQGFADYPTLDGGLAAGTSGGEPQSAFNPPSRPR